MPDFQFYCKTQPSTILHIKLKLCIMKIQKASPSQALLLIMACSYVVLTNAYIDVLDNDKTNSTAKSCTG